jgi:hypothetical protein
MLAKLEQELSTLYLFRKKASNSQVLDRHVWLVMSYPLILAIILSAKKQAA